MNTPMSFRKIFFIFMLCLLAVPAFAQSDDDGDEPGPAGDMSYMNLSFHDTTGKKVTLKDLKGKFIVVDFWASWCSPCLSEIEPMKKLEQDMAGNNKVVFVSISFDENEDLWKDYIQDQGMRGVQLFADPDDKDKIKHAFHFNSLPYFVWINAAGKIVSKDAARPSEFGTKAKLKAYILKG